jgi:hypothetical protein
MKINLDHPEDYSNTVQDSEAHLQRMRKYLEISPDLNKDEESNNKIHRLDKPENCKNSVQDSEVCSQSRRKASDIFSQSKKYEESINRYQQFLLRNFYTDIVEEFDDSEVKSPSLHDRKSHEIATKFIGLLLKKVRITNHSEEPLNQEHLDHFISE